MKWCQYINVCHLLVFQQQLKYKRAHHGRGTDAYVMGRTGGGYCQNSVIVCDVFHETLNDFVRGRPISAEAQLGNQFHEESVAFLHLIGAYLNTTAGERKI